MATDMVEQFRRRTGRRRSSKSEQSSLRERMLLCALGANLVYFCWAMGGMRLWAVWGQCGLAVATFALLFIPLGAMNSHRQGELAPAQNLRRLLRFPVFWVFLSLLGYMLVQAMNPAWTYTMAEDQRSWWLTGLEHNQSLPSSIEAPFAQMNAWRTMLNWSSVALLCCTFWCGIRRRSQVIALLWVLMLSAAAMVLVGVAMEASGTRKMYWFIEGVPSYFFGSFTYKNHAGAFLNLMVALSLSLFLYYFRNSRERLLPSSPHYFILMVAALIEVGVVLSDSRGAIAISSGIWGVFALLWLVEWLRTRHHSSGRWIGAIFGVLGVSFAAFLITLFNSEQLKGRLSQAFEDVIALEAGASPEDLSHSSRQRYFIYQATWKMAEDRLTFGWGAGSYRWYFPQYQRHFERIWEAHFNRRQKVQYYFRVEYAHCDYLQWLTELGLVGTSLILLLPATLASMAVARWRGLRVWPWMLLVGVGALAVHAGFDFVWHSPFILASTLLAGTAFVKLAFLNAENRANTAPSAEH